MKKILLFTLLFFGSLMLNAQVSIIPAPAHLNVRSDKKGLHITKDTKIVVASESMEKSALFLNQYLKTYFDITLDIVKEKPRENYIFLVLDKKASTFEDGYRLKSSSRDISIAGVSNASVFYGIQTLLQLLPTSLTQTIIIPSVVINDYPRFSYRGMHLDVSRHFFDIKFIKQFIDYLALHKLNYFHWHLTDDHGWRIEIKKYPKLTELGSWRNGTIIGLWPGIGNEDIKYQVFQDKISITPENAVIKTDNVRYGGYYSQEEIKEVVQYAEDRYITIIPEIEMPAHSMAVLAAYPELGTEPNKRYSVAETWGIMNKYNNVLQVSERTFHFLEDVLTEILDLFPSRYIHIGGDEASKVWWRQSAETKNFMKIHRINDEAGLQSYFIHRIEKFVNSKGRIIIGWDEILDGGLAPNAVVMSWRGEKGGIAAARSRQRVIMTPEDKLYFNHSQFIKDDSLTANKFLPLKDVYQYEPIPKELAAEEQKYIWGAQGNLWSEYISNPSKVQYMLFPRIDALSEVVWSRKESRIYSDFTRRLKNQFKRYDMMGIHYSSHYVK